MIKAIRGTRDILPPSSAVWNHVDSVARSVFRTFNYQEIRTPVFEETALFARGVGEETDIVSKEMYSFDDRDGTSLTLRPENTASVIRAYIEHRLDQIPGLKKLYYIGPMFRRERPQKGRYRQFYQIGAEAIGSDSPVIDAEVIELAIEILQQCGVKGWRLLINSVGDPESRKRYVDVLRERLAGVKDKLSPDNQRRSETNPLRVLDSKEPQDEPVIEALPSIHEYLNEACRAHFARVCELLAARGIPYEVTPRLVRGLDYYTKTTFEIRHGALGAQNSILGGGRYNGLAELLGSRVAAPGIGFSIGQDRLVMTIEEALSKTGLGRLDLFIAALGDAAVNHCAQLAAELRRSGLSVELSADPKLKRALETANKTGARFTLIVGDNEIAAGTYALKEMESGNQNVVARDAIAAAVRASRQ
ncbi:MAG: histidine--tRNA ligase [Bryobacterales bacterium]|nr:histidine--tRNA ligase [Bryobacterales bacterium]